MVPWIRTSLKDNRRHQAAGERGFTRFNDARALALRITPNKENQADIFYDEEQWWDDSDGRYYQIYDDNEEYDDPNNYDWWYGHEDDGDGEWVYEYDGQAPGWQGYGDDGDVACSSEPPATDHDCGTANAGDDIKEENYKGKGKRSNDGCFNCGSKWHMASDCPMAKGSGNKGNGKKGAWRAVWRPRFKGGGKGKGKPFQRGKGSGKSSGKKGNGRGKNHWYVGPASSENVGNLPLDFSEGVPDHTTSRSTASQRVLFKNDKTQISKVFQEKHIVHTSSEEDDFMSRQKPLA